MPIYEYRCSKGHITEVRQAKYEPVKSIICPECKDERRLAHFIISLYGRYKVVGQPITEAREQ